MEKFEFKFKVGDIIREKDSGQYFKIRTVYVEDGGYDAIFCDKDGNPGSCICSIDIWIDADPDCSDENDFEIVDPWHDLRVAVEDFKRFKESQQ